MKIDFTTVITDLANEPIKDGVKDLVLSTLCINALLTPTSQEQSAEEKLRNYRLAEHIYNAGEADLPVEDIVLLKKLIGKFYPPLVVGRAFAALDPELPKLVKSLT